MYAVCQTVLLAAALVAIGFAQTTIPVPTAPQLAYQNREIVGLTHFNMATFFGDGDPSCNKNNWAQSQNPKSFNPYALNVSNWVESYKALGAQSAVLTAKHGCGFCLWDTAVTLPNGQPYTYNAMQSSFPHDIVELFVNELSKNGMGYGFYYSLTNNFYLNEYQHTIQPVSTLLPGQQNVTQAQLSQIQTAQLTELFANYGPLFEFWFDGGTSGMAQTVHDLLAKYQPSTAIFGGQSVSPNAVRWVGTESGLVTTPIWSLGYDDNAGDPNASVFCPACCDTTLQNGDHWFYTPSAGIRSLSQLIAVYHDTVGNNGVLELDFAVDQTGNIAANQAQRYLELGNWIRSCYGQSNTVNQTDAGVIVISQNATQVLLTVHNDANNKAQTFDRFMIQEEISKGQRVRKFNVLVNGNTVLSSTAVGQKRIVRLKSAMSSPATVTLEISDFVGHEAYVTKFAVFGPCSAGQ